MRRLSVLAAMVVLAMGFAAAAAASIGSSTSASWHLVFSDGFGTGSLNPYTWTPNWLGTPTEITHPPNSYETAAFAPGRVKVNSYGHLSLSTRDYPWTDPSSGKTYEYRSGAITGYQKQAYAPDVKVVARLWLSCNALGQIQNWPSFWLVGDPYQWPKTGEIDIMEGLDGVATWHAHYQAADGTNVGTGATVPGNWCGWHTFQVNWWGATINWYWDGTKVASISNFGASAPEFPVIMYSMSPQGTPAPDGSLPDCPPSCGGPLAVGAHISADYVRIYKWY